MRGRKPKPISAQIAAGDPRKRGVHVLEKLQAAEPKAAKGLPPCPRHLRGRARAAWNMWCGELAAMDLDRRPDAQMLEGACTGYEQAVTADILVGKEGMIVKECKLKDSPCPGCGAWKNAGCKICAGKGKISELVVLRQKAHPAIAISRSAWSQVRSFCSEFGLSPVSRQRLAAEKVDESTGDLFELLSQPRQPRVA